MAYHQRTSAQQFSADWSKAVAWASSQGIGAASYLPIYQLDLSRIQNGEYPMGVAERNLEILAAHNPNQVTPARTDAPTGTPTPSNIWGNTIADAGKIATGLEGIFTGSFEKQVWNSAKATITGITHPASLEAPTLGGTIANWLTKTLAAYLPGAYDIGTVLHAEPTLTGSAGASALAEHPLVSLLDLIGVGEGGLIGKLGAHGIGGEAAAAYAKSAAEQGGILKAIGAITVPKGGLSLSPGQVALTERLSVKDLIWGYAAKIGPGGAGVGPALSDLGRAYTEASSMGNLYRDWLLEGPLQAASSLDAPQRALLAKVLAAKDSTQGLSVRQFLDDPKGDIRVKDALVQMLEGPLAFAKEGQILSGDMAAVQPLSGGATHIYLPTAASHAAVFAARGARDLARLAALKELGRLAPHVDAVAGLEAALLKGTKQFTEAVDGARKAVADDAGIPTGNVTQKLTHATTFRDARGISKSAAVHAVLDEGGLADQMVARIKESHDPVQIRAVAQSMKSRLSKWGPGSVAATEVPALAKLAAVTDSLIKWADLYQREGEAVDEAIHGEVSTQRELFRQHAEYRDLQVKTLRERHAVARENLASARDAKLSTARSNAARRINEQTEYKVWATVAAERRAEAEATRATAAVLNRDIMPRLRGEIAQINDNVRKSTADARTQLVAATKLARTEYQRDLARLARKQETEMSDLLSTVKADKAGMGEAMRAVTGYAKAVDGFQQAVFDHPSDEYRDLKVLLMQKHMMASEHSADLVRQTMRHVGEIKMADDQVAKLRSDPALLSEYMVARFDEIYHQATTPPEVQEMADLAMAEASKSGTEELKQLIGQGLRVEYIPSATDIDARLGRDSVAPVIGHGIPTPDMAKAKVWEMTPQLNDFAVGITKAAIQQLQRDATIELTEHYLAPMTLTKLQVANYIDHAMKPLERSLGGNIALESRAMTAESLGLTAFDPHKLFGFTMPRWAHDEVYLPTPMVKALEQLMGEGKRRLRLLTSSTKLFRYSILGLSPRYDAHVIFGGAMMGALQVSPYALGFIGQAAKALRDGELPPLLAGRHAVEEGGQETVLSLYNKQGARDMVGLEVAENIERRQGIAHAAAKPIHALRALADLNFRFARYVRDLQSAVVYLDGAAQATRRDARVSVVDPVTGKTLSLSPDRAMAAGMAAVERVYGNLGRMAPVERMVSERIMPFYGWQKHILSYVFKFPFDHPWRATVLSQMAFHASQAVPLAYPIRIQLLYFLGSPDAQGNVNAVDIRSLDPFRDVANYASWTGFFESLNPAISAIPAMAFGPGAVFGSSSLYPTVTYNSFYGIETTASQGNLLTGLSQWVPQVGAAQQALAAVEGQRSMWNTNRKAAIKSILESLNIPFVTPPVNLKQIAARDEAARYKVAAAAAYTAFSTGDFAPLAGYASVPNPLNPVYEVTPAELEALYQQSLAANPTVAPIEALLPPPTPSGW